MLTGVDIVEALGLVVTGVLQWRRSPRRALPAAIACPILALSAFPGPTRATTDPAEAESPNRVGL